MTRKLLTLLAGVSMLAATSPAQAQRLLPPTDDTTVSPVTVRGSKAPTADAPKSATCEYYAQKDPILRAQLAVAAEMGDPSMGPRLRLPTRLPRDPDLKSPPRSAPGSAMPEINVRRSAMLLNMGPDASMSPDAVAAPAMPSIGEATETDTGATTLGAGVQDFSVEDAVAACRAKFTPNGEPAPLGRAEIARNDKTLPLGFALYDDGRFEEALEQFKLAFKKLPYQDGGDEAALMVGKIYLMALRDKNDPVEAVTWLKKAGGAAFDPTTSIPVFDPRAPERNTAIGEACMLLGRIYLRGAGPVQKDMGEATKWFQRAFEVGHVAAAKVVGDLYYNGADGAPDLKKAFTWYRRGATLGHAPSQFSLARMYETGEAGKADEKLALIWYNEAAKVDHAGALYALAYAYDAGQGVKADPARALGLYKTAAIHGDSAAQAALASYFYNGDQVAKDHAMARKWFEAAARGGDAEAMFNLAAMMTRGEGGPVDLVHAWAWLHVAQIQKHPKAAAALAVLEPKMTAEQRAEATALVGAKTS